MGVRADAWFLHPGEASKSASKATLVRQSFELREPGDEEIIAEPIYGCWEGNMGHAVNRTPVDICRQRKEERVVIGNAGVVRVVSVGRSVKTVKPGQNAIIFCVGEEDWWGYPKTILGYDSPGSMGCLSTKMVLGQRQVIPIPENTKYSLRQWAAFSLRYVTAWSNWELAVGTFRLLVHEHELASLDVWGWGGGVSLAELQLARRFGHKAVMLSSSTDNFKTIEEFGITPIDRRSFGALNFEAGRYKDDPSFKAEYIKAEKKFLEEVTSRTSGRMVHIFIDLIGEPVYRCTLKALARQGIITTAGWKAGMDLRLIRAVECIERHQHIHTHYARYGQGWAAVAFAEANGWLPPLDDKTWSFDEIPALADEYDAGTAGMFPIFSIAGE
jgi:NADPH:quinone reductase-like Zn-dependent oxidoreductase